MKTIQTFFKGFFNPIWKIITIHLRKNFRIYVFSVLPLVFLLNASIIHLAQGSFFQNRVDPEYLHIYNGIAIGGGNLAVEYIAHPGTPLQYMMAISARIVHFFQSDKPYPQDFIDNPEKYIHAANLFMNILIALALLICGLKSQIFSDSYFVGFLIQLSPFGNASILGIMGRLIPESLMILPFLLISTMVVKNIYQPNKSNNDWKDMILYAIIVGFGIACKLSFFPVLLIPLILLKSTVKQKLQYLLYVLLFVAIFAYPVVFEFSTFWDWVSGMFTHTGMHGTGSKGFIDISSISPNFNYLFNHDKLFFYLIAVTLLLAFVQLFISNNKSGSSRTHIARAIIAVNVAVIVGVVFTLKHFTLHYFVPFYIFKYLLMILGSLSIIQLHKIFSQKRIKNTTLTIAGLFALFISFQQTKLVRMNLEHLQKQKEDQQEQYQNIIPKIKESHPIILTGPYYGTPFVDYAHYHGFIFSYRLKGMFKPYLKEKFPDSYLYVNWSDKFYFWDEYVDFTHIINQAEDSFYVYIGKENKPLLSIIEERLWQAISKELVTRKILFQDKATGEMLLEYNIEKEQDH